jgi:hypothetical protein
VVEANFHRASRFDSRVGKKIPMRRCRLGRCQFKPIAGHGGEYGKCNGQTSQEENEESIVEDMRRNTDVRGLGRGKKDRTETTECNDRLTCRSCREEKKKALLTSLLLMKLKDRFESVGLLICELLG